MVIMLVEGRRGTKKESLPLGSRVMSVWMYEYGNLGYHHCDRQNILEYRGPLVMVGEFTLSLVLKHRSNNLL